MKYKSGFKFNQILSDNIAKYWTVFLKKLKWLLKVKCVQQVSTKIKAQRKVNDTQILVDEVETQLREKPLRGSQTQDIHYSEDKARYKIVTLTYTRCSGRILISDV
jgi:hypothetical protein